MKNKIKKISLKSKVILIICIFIIYPLIIVLFSYKQYAKSIVEKNFDYSKTDLYALNTLLTERIEKISEFSVSMLYDKKIYYSYINIKDGFNEKFNQCMFEREFEDYLRAVASSNEHIYSVFFKFNNLDKPLIYSRLYTINPIIEREIPNFYKFAKKTPGIPKWYIARDENNKVSGIYLLKTVISIHSGEEIGILGFKINEESFFNILSNFFIKDNQNITLTDKNGFPIYEKKSFDSKDSITLTGSNLNKLIYPVFSNKNKYVYKLDSEIVPNNWNLTLLLSSNIILTDINTIFRNTSFLCLVTIPLAILLMLFTYIDIIKPLKLLINKMKNIKGGNFGVTIDIERNDELGYLFNSFNSMSREIDRLINKVYKEELAMKEAELKALQSQINPHFLYNTLDSINWRAQISGLNEISEMVSALSCIIEANLNRCGEKFITINEELNYINNYKLLIEKRFGQKIKFEINVDDSLLNCYIPKLTIQPLLENSVSHGLETKKGNGVISLSIEKLYDYLIMTVKDDGVGIREEKLNTILNCLKDGEKHIVNDRESIGITNVYRRLKLLYSDKCSFDITSSQNVGTIITIVLPEKYDRSDY